MKESKNRKGFTLIELIFVIVILGILSAVALPRFGNVADNAKISKTKEDAAAIRSGIASIRGIALLENNTTDLDNALYTGVYAEDTLVKVTKAKGYPQDLDTASGATFLAAGDEATFSSILTESPSGWKIKTVNTATGSGAVYIAPTLHEYTYTNSDGKFTCGTDCP